MVATCKRGARTNGSRARSDRVRSPVTAQLHCGEGRLTRFAACSWIAGGVEGGQAEELRASADLSVATQSSALLRAESSRITLQDPTTLAMTASPSSPRLTIDFPPGIHASCTTDCTVAPMSSTRTSNCTRRSQSQQEPSGGRGGGGEWRCEWHGVLVGGAEDGKGGGERLAVLVRRLGGKRGDAATPAAPIVAEAERTGKAASDEQAPVRGHRESLDSDPPHLHAATGPSVRSRCALAVQAYDGERVSGGAAHPTGGSMRCVTGSGGATPLL